MEKIKPSFIKMIRAPFLSSIYAPLIAGTLIAVIASGQFYILNFFLILVIGTGLHIATNVYNDIYDTLQGTDKVNVHRNEFSGGSGVLLDQPQLISTLYLIARSSLVIAFIATVVLTFLIDRELWPLFWTLYVVSAFLSKYYTAAPVKLAYRGFGEIFVWFAFGPMAILIASLGQNLGFHPYVLSVMALTGLSTLSILLIGQLIDLDADRRGGKFGIAVRHGTRFTGWFYFIVQLIIVVNIIIAAILIIQNGWPILLALIPYALLFPRAFKIIREHHSQPRELVRAAGLNVQIHLFFSLFFNVGLGITLLLNSL
ncbi:prenyltransferase [candidate division KSB1 bacterium]|nr:prenyltransferase [candidate division KSB1 bacterium]